MQTARPLLPSGDHAPLGVSLIELLVVVALLAVLASIAIPSFAGAARQYRVNAITEEFMASVQLARVEAIRMGQDVLIQRDTTCEEPLPTKADWHCGWRVFADLNRNQQRDANEVELQSIAAPAGVHVRKGKSGSGEYLKIDRYGQSLRGQSFAFFPADRDVRNGLLICFSLGTRLRTLKNAESCSDQPA
jgi:type IV fimbrial biogenesis protein FimT